MGGAAADLCLGMTPAAFLERYWQRQHLLIPQGFANFRPPGDPDELAGLAMEADVDSRIVWQEAGQWRESRGPFSELDYQRKGPWTLLVQGVDQHWDDAHALLHGLRFLPRWRLDDVLMSYATDGGSAGPHFDRYDVFIIQGEGQRRWQLGQFCDTRTPMKENCALALLAQFQPQQEYLMNCGDVLYIPPGQAHFGVSVGESSSYSIGFRAPRLSDLLAHWTDHRLTAMHEDDLLRDPGRAPQQYPGELRQGDLENAKRQLLALLSNGSDQWFGEALTESSTADADGFDAAVSRSATELCLRPAARIYWSAESDQDLRLYSHGSSMVVPAIFRGALEQLIAGDVLVVDDVLALHDAARGLLDWLGEGGSVMAYD